MNGLDCNQVKGTLIGGMAAGERGMDLAFFNSIGGWILVSSVELVRLLFRLPAQWARVSTTSKLKAQPLITSCTRTFKTSLMRHNRKSLSLQLHH